MDPNNPQNPQPFNPKIPISEVLKQEKEGFAPSAPTTSVPTPQNVIKPTLSDTVGALGAAISAKTNIDHQSRIIKTYKSDAEEALRQQGGSVIKVAVAENEKRAEKIKKMPPASVPMPKPAPAPIPKPTPKPTPIFVPKPIPTPIPVPTPKPVAPPPVPAPLVPAPEPIPVYKYESETKPKKKLLVPVLVVVILLALGGAAIPIAQYFLNQKKAPVTVISENTIIPFDHKETINLKTTSHDDMSSAIGKLPTNSTNIEYVEFFQNILDTNQKTTTIKMPTNNFAALIGPNMPSALVRSFDGDYMYGIDKTKTVAPFILFKTSSYDQTFAGMLKWENNLKIISDLTPILNLDAGITGQPFTDKIITSKDVRAVVASDGTIKFLYGFIDNQTLLITTDSITFQDLSNRYVAARFVQ